MKESNSKNMNTRSSERPSDTNNKLLYLLVGGGIGAVVALLFAPKQGSELRGDIAKATRDGLDVAKEKSGILKEQSAEVVQNLRDKATAAYGYASSKLSTSGTAAADAASNLGESAKNAAERTVNEIESPNIPNIKGGSSQVF